MVDIDDTPLGEMDKLQAHIQARLHRAVSVFIFNSKRQLLLQRRALDKYHSQGLWTNTACTHPRINETDIDAARRRLREEMGLDVRDLTKLFDFVYKERVNCELTEYEFDHVFFGVCDDTPLPNESEVCDFKYVDMDIIIRQVNSNPREYTVWFKEIIERVLRDVREKI